MNRFLTLLFLSLSVASCFGQQPAKVEYHVDEYYGYDEKSIGTEALNKASEISENTSSSDLVIEDISKDRNQTYAEIEESYGPNPSDEEQAYGPAQQDENQVVEEDLEELKQEKISDNSSEIKQVENEPVENQTSEQQQVEPKTIDISEKIHVVEAKETLYSLSRKYNIPILPIILANDLQEPYGLLKGQKIKIPEAKFHVVGDDDTLYSISRKYQVDMTSLAKINDLDPPYSIFKGQKLQIPFSSYNSSDAGSSKLKTELKKKDSILSEKGDKVLVSEKLPNENIKFTTKKKEVDGFVWPVKGKVIKKFGGSGNDHNDGINIRASEGEEVLAVKGGKVVYVGDSLKSFGNLVILKHDNGLLTAYAHMSKLLVKKDQKVQQHQPIGKVGKTGKVDSSQLYFAVRKGKQAMNPMQYLN